MNARNGKGNVGIFFVTLGSLFLGSIFSLAEVVLEAPQAPPPMTAKEYDNSFFGQPPARTRVHEEGRSPAGLQLVDPNEPPPAPQAQAKAELKGEGFTKSPSGNVNVKTLYGEAQPQMSLIPSGTKGVQEVALIAGDLGFFPPTVFVTRDIPVRMFVTGSSRNTLCIMMDTFNIKKQVRSQRIEEITFTPKVPGKYRFYCPVNGMEGTMVVKELTMY